MKNTITLILLLISIGASAKKVKFAVDMSNELVNTTGIHVMGDFQAAAGYPFDWDPGSTQMIQESQDTNVYSVVIDIPAFAVYKYRFINGDQSYEVEFVPEESRWYGAFDDNRWMYLDSLSDDTTFTGVFPYGANAPAGLALVVFQVNMINETIGPEGVHMGANYQGWNPAHATMVSRDDTIYRYQAYIPLGTYEYKFANGTSVSDFEYVPGPCAAVSGNREVVVTADMLVDPVNFGSCFVEVNETAVAANFLIYPNPSSGDFRIRFNDSREHGIVIVDVTGRKVNFVATNTIEEMRITGISPGAYTLFVEEKGFSGIGLPLIIQ